MVHTCPHTHAQLYRYLVIVRVPHLGLCKHPLILAQKNQLMILFSKQISIIKQVLFKKNLKILKNV